MNKKLNTKDIKLLLDYYNYTFFKIDFGISMQKIDNDKEDFVLKYLKIKPHKNEKKNFKIIYDENDSVKLFTKFLNQKDLIIFLEDLSKGTDFYNKLKINDFEFYSCNVNLEECPVSLNDSVKYIAFNKTIILKPRDLKDEFFSADIYIFNYYFNDNITYHNTSCPLYLFGLPNNRSRILFKLRLYRLGFAVINKRDKNLRLVVSYVNKEQQININKYFPFAFYLCTKYSSYKLYGDKKKLIEVKQNKFSWEENNYFEIYKEIFTLVSPILVFLFSIAFQYFSDYSIEIFYSVIAFTIGSIVVYYYLKNKYENKIEVL